MAGILEGLLGGGSDPMDIYGDLFSEKQRAALRDQQMTQGLLNAAAVFSKAGQASRLPQSIPWGEAAQALGGSGDEAMARMLKGMQVAEEVRGSRQTREWQTKLNQMLMPIWQKQMAMGQPLSPSPASVGATPPAAPGAPAGAPPTANAPPPMNGAPGAYGAAGEYGVGQDLPAMPTAPQQTGLLAPPQNAANQGEGLLAGLPPFGPDNQGLPDLSNIKIEQLSGEAAPAGDAGRQARVKFWTDQGAPQHVAEGIADRVKAESGFRSDAMGDQGTSGGLYQHHADRLSRLKSFAAQQNRPWTDPGVQDQFAATEVRGGDAIAAKGWPAILNAPDRQTAATLWDKYFERSKYGPGAGGSRDNIRVEPLGSEAAPAGAAPSGTIPGLGMTPEALATLNALMKVNKLGSPFDSLLETYYKSPGYLAEKARTEETSKAKVNLEYGPQIKSAETLADLNAKLQLQPKLEAAIEKAKNDPKISFEERKATIERYSKELEQLRAAGLEPVDVTVRFPGEDTDRKITITKAQLPELASGKGIPELGLPPMTGVKMGQPVERPEQLKQQEIDQKFLEEKRQQAESSRRAIMAANDTRGLIEKGVIAGSYADERTRLLKLGQLLNLTGRDDNERIKNTETYIANLGRGMKEGLKGLGPPVSNVDIQIAERIAGGQNLTTQGMLELLKLEEKYHRLALQDYGKLLTSAPKSRYDKSVKEPPTFGAPIADDPNGVAHWWDGKAWKPL